MRIIIAGAGEVGVGIAQGLAREGHEVIVVDKVAANIARLGEQVDCLAIEGNGASPYTLEQAGAQDTDMLIAVTDQDEVNMVACRVAGHFGIGTKIARVRNPDYFWHESEILSKDLGIDLTINPEVTAAEEIRRLLLVRFAAGIAEFADGRVFLIKMRIAAGMPIVGQTLVELRAAQRQSPFVVSAIVRAGETIVPSRGDIRIEAGDHLFVTTRRESLSDLAALTGNPAISPERVIIAGANRLGINLARLMERVGVPVTVVDEDSAACDYAADQLSSRIIRGDPSEAEVLTEAGLSSTAAFVGASDDDENNIVSAILAKQRNAMKVIAAIRKPGYAPLISDMLPIDAAISPRRSTVAAILRFVRRGRVIAIATMQDNEAETIELLAEENSPVIGKPLRQIFYPGGSVFPIGSNIGAIVRGDDVLVPTGDDVIRAGDRVVVTALQSVIPRIGKIFSGSSKKSLFK